VADEIRISVCAFQLEISVVGGQPGVEYLRDGYPTGTKNQRARRLLAAMACIALDTDAEHSLLRHLIHRTTLARDALPHSVRRNLRDQLVACNAARLPGT
jgi:hypothetical protein